jgi:hypothetical protein
MKLFILQVLALLVALPLSASAEQSVKFGDIEVHYNALVTTALRPEVARSYGVDRSKSRGLVTLAVLKKNDVGATVPVQANLKVNAINLTAQAVEVPMREINERTAIYYIGTFRLSDQETLKFVVNVKPVGGEGRTFDFSKTFYAE